MDDIFVLYYPAVSVLVGIGSLAAFIFKIGEWINRKAAAKAEILKTVTENTAKDLREITNKEIEDLRKRIDLNTSSLERLMARADLVNGNVSNIRTDIADLQQDLLELYDKKAEEEEEEAPSRRKRRDLQRRFKRRKIEKDRIDQQERRL